MPEHFDTRPHRDFTTFGFACPQILPAPDVYGGPIAAEQTVHFNENSCLSLTISVPKSQLDDNEKSQKLPVLVYVHGGALIEGTGAVDGLHDTAKMVQVSVKNGTPVIVVSICYRLNWLGFMACQDLLDDDIVGRNANEGPFNLGFYDQRKAFLWVHKIAGFGGDPSNITAFGESAGASSIICHMGSSEPLFKRAILQSAATFGTATLMQKDAEYQRLLAAGCFRNKGRYSTRKA